MLKKRYYYKRILTIHSEPIKQNVPDLLTKFRSASSKSVFNMKLTQNIMRKYEHFIATTHYPKVSLLKPEITNNTIELLRAPLPILCDCPTPIFGIEESLQFIPAPRRLLKNYSNRTTFGERVSEVYNQVYFSLINIAAKGRIFCRPEIRDPLLSALGPEMIKKAVEETIKEVGI
jgi:hypothetical protein